ncbi:MAG: porphobilinogen synthase, partial [Sinobacterium sp.]|nr:porphobilinogen synthase [Sinobacterium sp.]
MNIKPEFRFRRLRKSQGLRSLVRENHLHADDFIFPIFVEETLQKKLAISSMPGVYRYPEADLAGVVKHAEKEGVKAVILFGVSHCKDESGLDTLE